MIYDDEPRQTRDEMRIVLKDHLYYIYIVSVYEDNEKEFMLYPTPLTVPKASIEEMRNYIDKLKEAADKPVFIA